MLQSDFGGVSLGDLAFNKGDLLLLRPGVLPAQAYWLASVGGRRGYVPRYLLDPSWRVQVCICMCIYIDIDR